MKRLIEITRLKDNWDDNGAETPSQYLIRKVRVILRGLSHKPDLYPTPNNSILLEYEYNGRYIEFDVSEEKIEMYFCVTNDECDNVIMREIEDESSINIMVEEFFKENYDFSVLKNV